MDNFEPHREVGKNFVASVRLLLRILDCILIFFLSLRFTDLSQRLVSPASIGKHIKINDCFALIVHLSMIMFDYEKWKYHKTNSKTYLDLDYDLVTGLAIWKSLGTVSFYRIEIQRLILIGYGRNMMMIMIVVGSLSTDYEGLFNNFWLLFVPWHFYLSASKSWEIRGKYIIIKIKIEKKYCTLDSPAC